jgi:hypothetical protein
MLHPLTIVPGQTIMDPTFHRRQNLMLPLITPIVQIVVGNSLVHKTPSPGGIRAMLQNPLRLFFPFTWFACFSSILPSVHAGPPRFSCERQLT